MYKTCDDLIKQDPLLQILITQQCKVGHISSTAAIYYNIKIRNNNQIQYNSDRQCLKKYLFT